MSRGQRRKPGHDWLSALVMAGIFAFLLFALSVLVWVLATQPGILGSSQALH